MNIDHFTYRVTWSAEDGEHLGLCEEFPSLSWLAPTPAKALAIEASEQGVSLNRLVSAKLAT